MKRYFIVLLLLGVASCNQDSPKNSILLNASKIIGSWQIVSESYSIGGPQITSEIENGGIYRFDLDGTFNYSYSENPSLDYSGTFSFTDDQLTLHYFRDGENAYWDLKTAIEEGFLTWFPIGPRICIEGCSTTLKKIE